MQLQCNCHATGLDSRQHEQVHNNSNTMEQRRAERQQHGSISSRSNTAAEAAEEENSSSSSSSNSYSNRTPSIHCQDCQGEMRNIQTQIGSNCCASTRNNRHVNHYIFPAQATPRPAWHPHHAGTRTPLASAPPSHMYLKG